MIFSSLMTLTTLYDTWDSLNPKEKTKSSYIVVLDRLHCYKYSSNDDHGT